MNKLSEIGRRGLVIRDEQGTYYAVNEDLWRSLPQYPLPGPKEFASARVAQLIELNVALATLAESPPTIFVNLDMLRELPPGQASSPPVASASRESASRESSGEGRAIVLKEGDSLRYISEEEWGTPIPEAATGDARVLIRRGAVLAAIPQNDIPQGTFCVLINIKGLIKAPEEAL